MNDGDCVAIRHNLDAFVDDELTGAERLRVSDHLDHCADCRSRLQDLLVIGDFVRLRGEAEAPLSELAGLAGGVISRTRAEADLSWRRLLGRASEDWHWAVVAGGSLAATFASTLSLTAILSFGPAPERQDSVAGYYTSPGASEGVVARVSSTSVITVVHQVPTY